MPGPTLEKRFRAFVERLEKFEQEAASVTPREHEVSQLLHDLWGKRHEVEEHMRTGDIARARKAEAILKDIESRLDSARRTMGK